MGEKLGAGVGIGEDELVHRVKRADLHLGMDSSTCPKEAYA